MAHIEKDDAIILKTYPFRETSMLIICLSRTFGKLKLLAKGVRTSKSRILSHFEPFTFIEVAFYYKEKKELQLFSDSTLKESFADLRAGIDTICAASYMIDLVNEVSVLHQPVRMLFDILLYSLCELREITPYVLLRYFDIQVLHSIGLLPRLDRCVMCQRAHGHSQIHYSLKQGGTICSHKPCLVAGEELIRLSGDCVEVMHYLHTHSIHEIAAVHFDMQIMPEIESVLQKIIEYHIHTELRSMRVMREVNLRLSSRNECCV